MASGLVLTGGGALLRGLDTLAQDILEVPVRIGVPKIRYDMPMSLKSPMYATAYGLLVCALNKGSAHADNSHDPFAKRLFSSMKSWVSDFF
jgi:Actin-like ATPase involved in cell division